ncbi:hypothetical protein JRO89_XS04G0002800 [Xanthoceras sorbifolium]|uniref:Flap endonuclease 1 n=1 Tax=Xanthoceras sorbifolium TaxID=99658 RepID=A0ABQ8I3P5_9ROSI|nr:hypothetical protein JRO89_XS04G0002800 [Xanthoceras sorbifolium]
MGIKGLTKLLADNAPKAMKEQKFESYFGRKIAIDASMSIYQFLIVVGRAGTEMLTNEAGEVTSHLQGMFSRTIRLLESGMKPVYVFDGKPPDLKKQELAKRYSKRADATEDLAEAVDAGNKEDIEKFSKRTVKVTKQHNEDCKRLLRLMGVPVVEAPSEAEAQCAALCKSGKAFLYLSSGLFQVYAVASEDMDSLTFGAPRFLRHLMDPSSRKTPVMEFEVAKILEELNFSMDQFIDLCILSGCDYCESIRGIGGQTALKLIRQHGSIENILENINKDRYQIPEDWPYQEARRLFKEPEVFIDEEQIELKWTPPDEEGLITFLVNENGFNSDRVTKAIEKIKAAKNKSSQGRLESFFKPVANTSAPLKRKAHAHWWPKLAHSSSGLEVLPSIIQRCLLHCVKLKSLETAANAPKETANKKTKAGGGRKKKYFRGWRMQIAMGFYAVLRSVVYIVEKLRCLSYAQLVFHQIQNPDTQSWNSLIRGFSLSQSPLQAILFYNQMLLSPSLSPPDTFTFSFTLKACERLRALNKCLELHGFVIRSGLERDVVVCTSLLRCYAANGLVEIARLVFDKMSERDLVSWNSMISCYSQANLHLQALEVYDKMRSENVSVDGFTLVGLLSSCAHVGALNLGVFLHGIASESGFLRNVYVGNALIDMYAKCGDLGAALSVFNGMQKRDVFTWNSMIVGYGVHGRGDEAISFFRQMLMAGLKPNSITFLGLLCGCSHQGLVEEGVEYFHIMVSRFNLKPGIKHYGCLVDLYGRAGQLDKALQVIKTSSLSQDDPVMWRTLLGSCKIHRNVEIGEIAMKNLVRLGASCAGDFVLLATIYAAHKDAQGVARMRKSIKSQGIKTTPGWSWIDVGDQVHRFVVDDKSHPETGMIYRKLEEVIHRANLVGYVKEESLIAMAGSSEDCMEKSTMYHSEKLAIAFGLERTSEGTCLRIVKNLRVCRDCHSFTKFVSKAFSRDIIVRDRVRFHHFKDGICSCRDFW